MSYYVLEDGRILSDISIIKEPVLYIEVADYPYPVTKGNMVTVCVGIENGGLKYETREIAPSSIIKEDEETPAPTQLDIIEDSQNVILLAIAEQYEKQQTDNLAIMEAQATIYEALLTQSGGVE